MTTSRSREGVEIGPNALLLSGVRIGRRVRIGARFRANPNVVLGADGFSYVTPDPGAIEEIRASGSVSAGYQAQKFQRIHSLGTVVIGDDVEIGANATIDRGTLQPTRVGSDTKIDNLVMVGHNVEIRGTLSSLQPGRCCGQRHD